MVGGCSVPCGGGVRLSVRIPTSASDCDTDIRLEPCGMTTCTPMAAADMIASGGMDANCTMSQTNDPLRSAVGNCSDPCGGFLVRGGKMLSAQYGTGGGACLVDASLWFAIDPCGGETTPECAAKRTQGTAVPPSTPVAAAAADDGSDSVGIISLIVCALLCLCIIVMLIAAVYLLRGDGGPPRVRRIGIGVSIWCVC